MTPPDAVLRTERLVVRDWRDDEADRMLDMYSRPDVVRFLGSAPTPMRSADEARARISRARERNAEAPAGHGWWAVEVASSGTVAGTVAVVPIADDPDGTPEIAWHLHPDSQGLGYATEAARAVLDRAHAAGVPEVLVLVSPDNAPSLAVARRLGVTPRGRTERYYGMALEVFASERPPVGASLSFDIRAGSLADAPLVVALFDDAIRWMVDRGLTDQWGSELFSTDPKRTAAVSRWIDSGDLLVAERDGVPAAAMVLGDAPEYAPPATEPELYVVALVASRRLEARGAGRALLAEAERVTAARGVRVLRLDCFAGNGGALVRYYESAGFRATERFTVGESWPGQVLERVVVPSPTSVPAPSTTRVAR
ncbi:MAG TPA: GNAT family N-acetyltransferase [Candidatus Angelobacter sp.]|nr:GNAT family N-acetyltransferase [Candidatus Angelobacter sp.]